MFTKRLKYFAALCVVAVGLSACGDSGTNATEEDPPEIPKLEYSQPDVSYFNNNSVQNKSASNSYLSAQSMVLGYSTMTSLGQIYGGFLESAPENEASFENGVWEWSYSYNYGGVTSEMRMTAEESGGSTNWSLFWSFDNGQGESIEDYNIMNGTIQNDGLSGDWTFNSMNPENSVTVPILKTSWVTDGETEHSLDIEFYNEDSGSIEATINYEQSGNDYTMTVTEAGSSSSVIVIYWNPETNLGYIQEGTGERMCWDSSGTSVVDVDCSAAGL